VAVVAMLVARSRWTKPAFSDSSASGANAIIKKTIATTNRIAESLGSSSV